VNILNAVYTPGVLDAFNGFAELSLTAQPAGPCTVTDVDAMILSIQMLPDISAGGNATIYETQDYTLQANAENFSSLQWETSGDGTFSDATAQSPVYAPGDNDIAVGTVELCLHAVPITPCIPEISDCMTLTILGAINSNFSAAPKSGLAPLTVQFTDLSSGGPVSWQWDFNNDGTIDSEEQNPEWTYDDPGLYTVSLTVSDGENVDVETKFNYISVNDSQLLELSAGWNDISSYLIPNSPAIENVVDPISGEVIILQNLEGFYFPEANVNTLGDWDMESGYFIKLNNAASLSIDGAYVPNPEIQLEPGWNLVPVINNAPVSITKLFADNLSKVEIVKDGIGVNLYWLEQGIFSLQELLPGESYFVKTTEGFTLSYANVNSFVCGDIYTDERDGREYETVQIGDQCWMAENLAYLPDVSPSSEGSNTEPYYYVYDYQGIDVEEARATENFQFYGVLYNWLSAMTACPDGWNLPGDDEWKILEGIADSQYPVGDPEWDLTGPRGYDAAKHLKSETGWFGSGNGDDLYSFSALPAGQRYVNGEFINQGGNAYWWTYNESWQHSFSGIDKSHRYSVSSDNGYSVRCIKEAEQNLPPSTPSSPIPINGSVNQSLEADLSWSCYDPEGDPLTFDVYFGTDENPPLVSSVQSEPAFDSEVLQSNTQYFWKVVAYDNQGNSAEGNVWTFTTLQVNLPPIEPSTPSPENGAVNQSVETVLTWFCSDPEGDPVIYKVFFGKDSIPDMPTSIQIQTNYDPGVLEYNAEYFWKIMALDNQGNFTESSIWNFQTVAE
jgi:uncharacterized protein (TIGR02145 family)